MQQIENSHVYLHFVFTGKYWSNALNCRKIFIDFASKKRFDPLVATNWANIQRSEIIKQVKRKVRER